MRTWFTKQEIPTISHLVSLHSLSSPLLLLGHFHGGRLIILTVAGVRVTVKCPHRYPHLHLRLLPITTDRHVLFQHAVGGRCVCGTDFACCWCGGGGEVPIRSISCDAATSSAPTFIFHVTAGFGFVGWFCLVRLGWSTRLLVLVCYRITERQNMNWKWWLPSNQPTEYKNAWTTKQCSERSNVTKQDVADLD